MVSRDLYPRLPSTADTSNFHHQKYHRKYDGRRENIWYLETDIKYFHHHSSWNSLYCYCVLHSCWLSSDWVCTALLVVYNASANEMCWDQEINCVGCQVSMVSVTGLRWRKGVQWHQERGINECVLVGVAFLRINICYKKSHSDCLLAGFVGF